MQQRLYGTKKSSNSLLRSLINEYYSSDDCEFDTNMFTFTITGKYAQQGGHSAYATPIYNCTKYIELATSLLSLDNVKP